ncbi:MAG: phytoene/squalene synthase family protein [Candidatus Thermoplasmatota archaeon]|nr:phytoene/squalene synthase family protein [Candidatus Thermoplasmatota archaeon]
MERRKPLDLLFPLKGGAESSVQAKTSPTPLDRLRAGVMLARDAVKAVSVTAMEALREGAMMIGLFNEQNELIDPFVDLDAPIWSDQPPVELYRLAYRYCEELTKREAGNFYHSFKYLPDEQRLAMCAVYAFCRRADDIADGDWADRFPGSTIELSQEAIEYRIQLESLQKRTTILEDEVYLNKINQLFFFRKKLSTCYNEVYSTDPVFLALKDTIERYNISRGVFDDLISGMEDDLYSNRYRTFEELYVYCYRVASVVGLMCIEIYGYDDPRARKFAESWGIFMQLTNVLRDVGEDIERDRVYLPLDELERNGMTETDLVGGKVVLNPTWEPYCHHYAKRARTYLEEARQLLPLLPRRTRYSPAAMIAFYDKILKQIEKQQGDVFTRRVKLNKFQKLSLAAAVYLRHRFLPRFLDPVWGGLARIGLLPNV